jgi:hypothetical protein
MVFRRAWHWHRTSVALSARRATLVASAVFWLLVTAGRPWLLFARGGFSTDFYDAQARAFLHLHLDVPSKIAGMEGFLMGGRTYLYYGPFLAVLRMPIALFGTATAGRLSAASMLLGFFVACTATWHVAEGVRRLVGGGSDRRSTVLVAAVASSPLLGLAGWNSVYDETELWACALALVALAAAVEYIRRPSIRSGVLAAGAASCAFLTRSSVGLGALVGVGLVALLAWRERRAALATLGTAIVGVALGVVLNLAKFSTAFGLPADRQLLTLQDPGRAAWFAGNHGSFFGLRFIPTTLLQYLRPDAVRVERLLPLVRFGPLARNLGSYPLLGNTPAGSLPDAAALLLLAAAVGVVLVAVRRRLALLPLWLGTVIATVPTFAIGFIAYRYLVDLLPMLVLPAAVALALLRRPTWCTPRAGVAAIGLAVVAGLWVNVSLGLWIQNLKRPGFTEVRYAVDDAIFGGTAPSALRIRPGAPVPRDGVVGVDGDCDGLYIAEQGAWVPLQLSDGTRVLRGTVDLASLPASIRTATGNIVVAPVDDGVVVRWEAADGSTIVGDRVLTRSVTVSVDATSDPILGHVEIDIDGQRSLFAFTSPPFAGASVDQTIRLFEPRDSSGICEPILRRLPSTG